MPKIDTSLRVFLRLLKKYFGGEVHLDKVINQGKTYSTKTIRQTVEQLELMREEGELQDYNCTEPEPPF